MLTYGYAEQIADCFVSRICMKQNFYVVMSPDCMGSESNKKIQLLKIIKNTRNIKCIMFI